MCGIWSLQKPGNGEGCPLPKFFWMNPESSLCLFPFAGAGNPEFFPAGILDFFFPAWGILCCHCSSGTASCSFPEVFREAGKTIPWSIPKKFWMDLDRFREILKGSLWNSTQSWILTDRTTRLFPWEIFFFQLVFPGFFLVSNPSFFRSFPLFWGGPNRCYSELQSSTLRVFFGHSQFYPEPGKTLGILALWIGNI